MSMLSILTAFVFAMNSVFLLPKSANAVDTRTLTYQEGLAKAFNHTKNLDAFFNLAKLRFSDKEVQEFKDFLKSKKVNLDQPTPRFTASTKKTTLSFEQFTIDLQTQQIWKGSSKVNWSYNSKKSLTENTKALSEAVQNKTSGRNPFFSEAYAEEPDALEWFGVGVLVLGIATLTQAVPKTPAVIAILIGAAMLAPSVWNAILIARSQEESSFCHGEEHPIPDGSISLREDGTLSIYKKDEKIKLKLPMTREEFCREPMRSEVRKAMNQLADMNQVDLPFYKMETPASKNKGQSGRP